MQPPASDVHFRTGNATMRTLRDVLATASSTRGFGTPYITTDSTLPLWIQTSDIPVPLRLNSAKWTREYIERVDKGRYDLLPRLEGMATDIKLSRFNNTPWGFRLSGGADFPHPLTVVRVARGSLADDAGLQPGDVLIRINNRPLQDLTHAQAHDWLLRAGNNFVVSVVRNHRIATEAH